MFTKKFLPLGIALLLALVGVGTLHAFAASANSAETHTPTRTWNTGIAAIPPLHKNPTSLLSRQEVVQYLHKQGFMGGTLVAGHAMNIQEVQLTNPLDLKNLKHILVPGTPADKQIYYVKFNGPFAVSPNPPPSLLGTLLPNSNTLPLLLSGLRNLPLVTKISDLGAQLGDLGNADLPFLGSINDLPLLNSVGNVVSVGNAGLKYILKSLFAVFDAHNGNLLVWGTTDRP
ncbi:MAG TPA: hypothetical protein VFV38_41490 [Ktedonobacteraceae bacterium]|nr:hypothetical protein [Ktedonobacteraceae bacterium]